MIIKKLSAKFVLVLVAAVMSVTACKSMPEKMMGGGELAPWKGEWVTADAYNHDPSMEPVYTETAAMMPNYTTEGLKAAIDEMYYTPIVKAKFDGSNTVMFTIVDGKGKEVELKCTYMYKGRVEDKQYAGAMWDTFEAVKEVRGLESAKYMILLPPHGHGDGPMHWHGRFGRRSIESLLDGTNWPTYYSASMPKAAFLENTMGSIKMMPKFIQASPFADFSKHGKWMNSAAIYDNMSMEVQAVYKKLIEEFKGKNPKGGDFTKEDIIAEMKKSYGSGEDFSELEFITSKDKNEMVVYKNGKEIFRSSYKRVGASDSKPSLMAVAADKPNAGKFSLISFTGAHGNPLHIHLWYGADNAEMAALKIVPTVIPSDTSNDKIALRVEASCRRMLTNLIGK
ncbi:ZinT/AdcA family metal-binding protein [Treponema pedis]|uniref:Hemin-binding protein B n=1 Tax=Treponema pedis str. T A4 TaxID=1291379 RepID=S5ZS42_9SPIR|nr:ZinT/AdcA family metal-binding protein [Treponema pedis]AGT42880.1 hemin-binding protein B [Treponema pedis str. T A4]